MSKKHKNTSTIPPLGSPPIKTSKSTSKSASGSHTQSSSMPKSSSITHTSTSTPPARLVKQTSHGKVPLLAFGQSEGQSTPTKGMVILRKSQTSKWSAGYKSRKSDLEFWYQFSIGEDQFSQQRNLRVPFWFLTKEAESPPTSTPQQAIAEGDGVKKPQEEAPKDAYEEGAPKDELKPKLEVRVMPISKAGSKGNVFESPLLDFTPKKLSLKSYQEWEDKMHAEVEERIRKSRSPDEDQSLPPTFSRSPRRKVEDVVLNLTPEMRAKLKSYDIDSLKKLGINVSDLEHSHMNGNDVDSAHCNIDLPSSDSPFSVSLPSLHLGESHASVHNTSSSSSSSSSSSNTQHGILDRSNPENSSSDPSATSLSGSHEPSDSRFPLSPKNESGTLVSLTASDGQYESDAEHVSFPPSSPHSHDSYDDPIDLNYLSSPRQTEPSSPQRSVSPRRRKKEKEREREKEKEREKERALLFSPRDKDKDREKKDSKKGKKKLNIGSSAMKFMRTPRGNVGPTPRKTKKGGDDLSNTVEARIQQELLTMELLSSCVDEQSLRAVITQGAVEKLITETYHPAKKKGIMIELLDDEEGRRESIAAVREYQKEKHEREKREKEKPSDPADFLNSSSSSSSSSPSLSVLDSLSPSSPNYVLPLSPKPSSSPSLTPSSPPRNLSPSSESPISRDTDQKDE